MGGVALGDIDLHFVWQVWHLATSTIYLTHRAKRQPSASAKNLLQAIRSHDGLRGLLGHIAHAAKTNGCHSPLFMVLARRLWLHNIITRHLSTTFVDIQHFNSHYVLTPHLCTHFCPTQLFHIQFFDTLSHACLGHTTLLHPLLSTPLIHPHHFHTRLFHTHTHHFYITPLHTLLSPTTLFINYTELFYKPHFDTHFLHTPILHHLFPLSCLSHPIFTFLWLLIGRS